MNYTNPNSPEHQDTPQDWLNSAMIFARTLGLVLQDGEGVVVELTGDVDIPNVESGKVIVFRLDGMIRITECDDDNLEEGQFVKFETAE